MASFSSDEFFAMLRLINEMGQSGKLGEIFQVLQTLAGG